MTAFWVVISTALLTFCLGTIYNTGYRAGARRVLTEWKEWNNTMGVDGDEEN